MNRKLWIDYARGICAFCVLISHTTNREYFLYLFNGFFLMLFFFISGYLHRDRNVKDSIHNLFRSLIIPYFCLSILGKLCNIDATKQLLSGDIEYIQTTAVRILWGRSLWFVSCLVCVRLLFLLIQHILYKIGKWNNTTILLLSIFAILFVFVVNEHHVLEAPFWYYTTALYSFGFYLLGNYCRKIKLDDKLPKIRRVNVVMLLIAYFLFSYFIQACMDVEFHVYTDSFKSPIVFILLALSGIACICCFTISICDIRSWINKYFIILGQNSLLLFAFNARIRISLIKLFAFIPVNKIPEAAYIILLCVVQGVVVICVGHFVNKYMPWIVGKHK